MMIKTIEQNVINFIDENNLIEKGDKILVALSGGADSVFLLNFLVKYKNRFKIEIAAFHLNHKLRGKDADTDEIFCEKLAVANSVSFYSKTRNVKLFAKRNKMSLEEAARKVRYKELFSTARKHGFSKIATAHNSDDNAETILLNLFKGTGLKGLAGIPVKRDIIIRPLLRLKKSEILNYLQKKKISYRLDKTNLQSEFQRNFLRNEIIPLITEKINPAFQSALFRTSATVKKIIYYLDGLINEKINDIVLAGNKKIELDLTQLKTLNPSLQDYFIKSVLEKYFSFEVDSKTIDSIKKLLGKQVGRTADLSAKIKAVKERNKIVIYEKTGRSKNKLNISVKVGESKKVDGKIISIRLVKNNKKLIGNEHGKEYVSADKLCDRFQLRKWENGDRFYPLGMKGSKKVSDFLTEQKIDSGERKNQLVLTSNRQIVWVVNLRIDDRFKVKKNTEKVYELWLR